MSIRWGIKSSLSVVVAIISFATIACNASFAQGVDIGKALQQQQQILQQQEQRRRERLRKLRESPEIKQQKEREDREIKGEANVCLPIKKIIFQDAVLLNADHNVRDALKKPFLKKKCMNIIDIMSVVRVITNWYIDKGYITARAVPPEQDLSKGVLIIRVIEGRTEAVDIYDNGKPRSGLDTAFPRIIGKRLYIRDVEQGLDQINRLPTHRAKIRIEPGKKKGHSRLRVDTHKTSGLITGTIMDNYGLKSTGEYQTGGSISVNDLFGLYSSFNVNYKTSKPFDFNDNESEEYAASLSIPFGYWTLFFSGSHFKYKTEFEGFFGESVSKGTSTSGTVELDRVLHRDRLSKTRLSAFVTYKDSENFIDQARQETSSQRLAVAGGRLSHNRRIFGGLMDVSVEGHFGAPMFGSLKDEDRLPGTLATAEFTKVVGSFSFYRPLRLGGLRFALQTRGYGQWSEQELFGSERISIGGLYSVRGFRDESISGDVGGYVRNELTVRVPNLLPEKARKVFGNMDLFAGYDLGWLQQDKRFNFERGKVSGLAAGARLYGGYLYGEVAYEKALDAPDFIQKEDELVRFQAGMSFKW